MLSVSFFLRTPDAISQSQVYVSISNKEKRLQFATGVSFIAGYCNIRKKKGTKELVKKNTVFYFEYTSKLREIRDALIRAEMDLSKTGVKCTLEQVRDTYYTQIGKFKGHDSLTFYEAYDKFLSDLQGTWGEGTKKSLQQVLTTIRSLSNYLGRLN